uniref:Signal transducer and activator of transcription n=2 Tax=Cacopsylla melanoneura TaxID=428564 RepID=A0A8D8XA37_9HEMI
MALWLRAQKIKEVRDIYGGQFPLEVRDFLSTWIEDKAWSDIDLDNAQHAQYATSLVNNLVQELENQVNIMARNPGGVNLLLGLKLQDVNRNFKQRAEQDPCGLFKTIQNCLKQEMEIVRQKDPLYCTGRVGGSMPMYNQNALEIFQELEAFRLRSQNTAGHLHKMDNHQQSFNIVFHDCAKSKDQLDYIKTLEPTAKNLQFRNNLEQQLAANNENLNKHIQSLVQLLDQVVDDLRQTCFLIENTQSKILNVELLTWKREQQLQGNGAKFNPETLEMIQRFCEDLAEIIWNTRQQIKEGERLRNIISKSVDLPNRVDVLPNLNAQITQCLSHLVTSTFIIEKQPPQVMKTNTRFSATVRLLTGSKLNVYMTPPQVKAQIICEGQANALLKNEKIGKSDASGEILNNMGVMEYHAPSRILSISLRNMQLKKIKRAEKRGTESVMDEKFSLYFSSQFSIGGGELVFQVWTLSLPVVVIVHGNQEPHAHATITWDNAFAEPGRSPFAVPDKRPWSMIAEVLKMKFESATGRSLDAENLNFLAEKAFRAQYPEYSNMLLGWTQFCKEPLPDRTFTFWEWFYAVMKLTREHLKNVWSDGLIMGFVRKRRAEEMLSAKAKGTFLLRFSDSELGGITIAYVGGNGEVLMIQPFTCKDFQIRNLADRISDIPDLMYLYPEIPKDQAFGKYYTPIQDPLPYINGYVKPILRIQIPGSQMPSNGLPGGMNSYPSTPQNMFHPHSPPDHTRDTASVVSGDSNYPNGVENGTGMEYDIFNQDFSSSEQLPQINEEDVLELYNNSA